MEMRYSRDFEREFQRQHSNVKAAIKKAIDKLKVLLKMYNYNITEIKTIKGLSLRQTEDGSWRMKANRQFRIYGKLKGDWKTGQMTWYAIRKRG